MVDKHLNVARKDENGREWTGKSLSHFCFLFYYGKRECERNSRVREWKRRLWKQAGTGKSTRMHYYLITIRFA